MFRHGGNKCVDKAGDVEYVPACGPAWEWITDRGWRHSRVSTKSYLEINRANNDLHYEPVGSRPTPAQPNSSPAPENGGVIKPRRVGTLHGTAPTAYEKTNDGAGPSAMESTMNTLSDPPELSPLEQEVLEEYEVLAENMKKVRPPTRPTPPICSPRVPQFSTSRSPFPVPRA